jgi:hypothetical protein
MQIKKGCASFLLIKYQMALLERKLESSSKNLFFFAIWLSQSGVQNQDAFEADEINRDMDTDD